MMTGSNNQTQPLDQRLHERFTMHLPVRVALINSAGVESFGELITANISSGGAFISTDQPLPIASRLAMEFLISFIDLKKLRFILSLDSLRRCAGKPAWVKATGVVIRHEEDGMAVIFDDDYQLSPMHISD
ncbi:MAG: PilZ domain-containing protein [Desulfofustis sp.]|nr:PilZ domain-containing protein [Desulfofustis sp.]